MKQPSRFLLVTWDGGGVVPPELGLARKLIARGHAVHVLADPTVEAEAHQSGCTFGPWRTAPHRTSRDRSADLLRDYAYPNKLKYFKVMLREFLAGPIPRWTADVLAELAAHPADLVLCDHFLPGGQIAAEKAGLPTVALIPNILTLPTPGIPPFGPGFLPARGPLGRGRDALVRWLSGRMFNQALPALNAERQVHGLEPVASMAAQTLRARQVFVLSSPALDFTSPAVPANVAWVGPQLDDPSWSAPWQSPWPADDARPLVLVGLSSTFQDQVPVLKRIVEALSALPVRALVTLGPTLLPDEVPGADNVVVVPSAPHGPVLREASVLVTHCGHGTTLKGLAAGVPLVCLPMGRDQLDTAARVVHRGAGLRLKPSAPAERIRAAVAQVLAGPAFRAGARRLAEAIANGEGCADPVAALESIAVARQAAA